MTYKLIARFKSGYRYEVVLTRSQAIHMLSLWGEGYSIDDVPITSPSGSSQLVPVLTYFYQPSFLKN